MAEGRPGLEKELLEESDVPGYMLGQSSGKGSINTTEAGYCEVCESETEYEVGIELAGEDRFARQPHRVLRCKSCGEEDYEAVGLD